MDEENIAGVPLPPPQESISNPASSLAASGLATSPHATSPLATMLLEAAARFVDLPAAEFDQVISQTLDQLATYVEMEHVGLSLIQQSQLQVSVERRYVAGGTYLPSADELATPYPWYAAQLSQGHSIG